MGEPSTCRQFRFGPFEVDLRTGELRKHGVRLRIQQQQFTVLVVLLERADEVVSREDLQKTLWADSTFVDFDHGLNIVVNRLRQLLHDSAERPRYIETFPRRGYRFIGEVQLVSDPLPVATQGEPPIAAVPDVPSRRPRMIAGVSAMTLAAVGLFGVLLFRARSPGRPERVTPLTTELGMARHPSISPDGTRVAYSWYRPQATEEVAVKVIGAENAVRLADGFAPAWSPDGSRIAFLRESSPGRSTVHVMSAMGGSEQTIGEVVVDTSMRVGGYLAWTADAKWLIASDGYPARLVLLSTITNDKVLLTSPTPTIYVGDFSPAVSPSGDEVAFVRYISIATSEVYRLRFAGNLHAAGEPERLTFLNRLTISPSWSPDGHALFFSADEHDRGRRVWRMPFSGRRSPEPVDALGEDVGHLAIRGNRLVYSRLRGGSHISAINLGDRPGLRATRFTASTQDEENPQYSPEGGLVAFSSKRSGGFEIWTCDREGRECRQITFLSAVMSGFPRWSPDGKQIVFHSRPQGVANIFVVNAGGGQVRSITSGKTEDYAPSWSHDGRTIYFTSVRSGEEQIWRIPAQGGQPVQVTRHGGFAGLESPDGKFLYYSPGIQLKGLWRVPVEGGAEELVDVSAHNSAHAFTAHGVYFIAGEQPGNALRFLPFSGGKSTLISKVEGLVGWGLSASPDGRRFLYTQPEPFQSDLILVEGGR